MPPMTHASDREKDRILRREFEASAMSSALRWFAAAVLATGLPCRPCLPGSQAPSDPEPKAKIVIVVGAPGTDEFGARFEAWAGHLEQAASSGSVEVVRVGPGARENPAATDRDVSWLPVNGDGGVAV